MEYKYITAVLSRYERFELGGAFLQTEWDRAKASLCIHAQGRFFYTLETYFITR
jgi:hypothetical protein